MEYKPYQWQFEYSLSRSDKEARIITNQGTFVMSPSVYEAYRLDTQHEKNFPFWVYKLLTRAMDPDRSRIKYHVIPPKILDPFDEEVRAWARRTNFHMEDYFKGYDCPPERFSELLSNLGPLVEGAVDEALYRRFQSDMTLHPCNTDIDHKSFGSSSTPFFGNPFMPDPVNNPEYKMIAQTSREDWIKQRSEPLHIFLSGRDHKISGYHLRLEELRETLSNSLRKFYESGKDLHRFPNAPNSFEKITSVRVKLRDEGYDENLVAFGNPSSLDFAVDSTIVAQCTDPAVLAGLKPIMDDVRLADRLVDEHGTIRYVSIKSSNLGVPERDNLHQFKEIEPAPIWDEAYAARISRFFAG